MGAQGERSADNSATVLPGERGDPPPQQFTYDLFWSTSADGESRNKDAEPEDSARAETRTPSRRTRCGGGRPKVSWNGARRAARLTESGSGTGQKGERGAPPGQRTRSKSG